MSCTTNPGQKFAQFTDKSHHRDVLQPADYGQEFRSRQRADLNDEFHQFAHQAPPVPHQGFSWNPQQSQAAQSQVQHTARQGINVAMGSKNDEWVHQFSSMNVAPKPAQSPLHDPLESRLLAPSQFPGSSSPAMQSFAPRFAYAEAPRVQPAPSPLSGALDSDFDSAFKAAESRVSAITTQMDPQVESQSQDLHKVARSVLTTVSNTTTTDVVAEKMRKSNFLNLMVQLSNKSAIVKDNAIVSSKTTGNDEEWAGPQVKQVEVKAPIYEERELQRERERERELESIEQDTPNKLQDPVGGQQPAEPLEEYLHRIGTPEQPPTGFLSPLEAANQIGEFQVNSSQWEEDYSAWR